MREIRPSDLVNLLAAVADRAIKDATGSVKALPTRHRESAVLFLDECLPEWRRFVDPAQLEQHKLRPMNCQASDRC